MKKKRKSDLQFAIDRIETIAKNYYVNRSKLDMNDAYNYLDIARTALAEISGILDWIRDKK